MTAFDKSSIKALALDLDGTILDRGELVPGVLDVLGRVSALGIEIILATGRARADIPAELLTMPHLNYVVTLNGACVSHVKSGESISRTPLEPGLLAAVLDFAGDRARYAHFMRDDSTIASPECLRRTRVHYERHMTAARMKAFFETFHIVESPLDYIRAHAFSVDKLVLNGGNATQCAALRTEITSQFDLETAIVEAENIELTARGVSKATGIARIAEHAGFSLEQTLAIGDSGNDILMLQAAGYAVAMGNASDEVKALADRVAPPVTEGGAVTELWDLFFREG